MSASALLTWLCNVSDLILPTLFSHRAKGEPQVHSPCGRGDVGVRFLLLQHPNKALEGSEFMSRGFQHVCVPLLMLITLSSAGTEITVQSPASSLRLEAVEYRKQEKFQRSLDSLKEALHCVGNATDTWILTEKMLILKELGITSALVRDNLAQVENYFDQALGYAKLLSATSETGNIERDLGIVYRQATDSERARLLASESPFSLFSRYLSKSHLHLTNALKAYESIGDVTNTGETLCELATMHQTAGALFRELGSEELSNKEFSAAEILLTSAEHTAKGPLVERGNQEFLRGDIDKAAGTYRDCLSKARAKGHRGEEAVAAQNLGMVLLTKYRETHDPGMIEEIISTLTHAAALAEETRISIGMGPFGQLRSGYFSEKVFIHEQLVDLLVSLGRIEEAYLWVERAKARGFLDLISWRKGAASDSPPAEDFKVEYLANLLPEGTCVLEYFLGDLGVYRFLISPGGLESGECLSISTNSLLNTALAFRNRCLLNSQANLFKKEYKNRKSRQVINLSFQKESHILFKELVGGLWPDLQHFGQVCVIPHHILHYLPFHALCIESTTREQGTSSEAARFWIEEGPAVGYAPSGQALKILLESHGRPLREIAGFADPAFQHASRLPNTRRSADFLKTLGAQGSCTIFIGEQVTASEVMNQWEKCDLLYLGTHGKLVAEDPLSSFLVFPATQESMGRPDFFLTAARILGLPGGPPQIVIMSACESGLSEPAPHAGDDLMGLNRALLARGVRGVVSTLWSVPDSTSPDIDCAFLEGLIIHKESGPSAMKRSMKQFLARSRMDERGWDIRAHPFWWAAFAFSGDLRPVP